MSIVFFKPVRALHRLEVSKGHRRYRCARAQGFPQSTSRDIACSSERPIVPLWTTFTIKTFMVPRLSTHECSALSAGSLLDELASIGCASGARTRTQTRERASIDYWTRYCQCQRKKSRPRSQNSAPSKFPR